MPYQHELVAFSHLRWNFVFQRPQQLLSRLAQQHRVFFIEEPMQDESSPPRMEVCHESDNIWVVRPFTPVLESGYSMSQMPAMRTIVRQLVEEYSIAHCISWFYTPLALPLLEEVPHDLVVFDCMDALDGFLNAPPLLKQREKELVAAADLVFTGGPSLYKRLEGRHRNLHCFPSSVDSDHFSKARSVTTGAADQSALSHPRLGYCGVIDERLDLSMIDAIATSHPEWQVVMVGPVVKISEASLPKRDNVHYLGQKQYAELPGYIGGWDVCLLPFARNESTRYISPTKTLEYMAAEKPIVSTPITDVAEPYGDIVYLADTAEHFVSACERALEESAVEHQHRAGLMQKVLGATSWDRTAHRMEWLMDQALQARQRQLPTSSRRISRVTSAPASQKTSASANGESSSATPPVVVIGAGPTGLSAAYHLGSDALLVEQNDRVGGWCRSLEHDGFTFDFAGHIMFSNEPYVHQLYRMLLGDNVHWQDREAWIYSKQTYTRYPFQGALHGLPADVIKECIVGAIEARFGKAALAKADPSPASADKGATNNGHGVSTSNGDGKADNGDGKAMTVHGQSGNGTRQSPTNGTAYDKIAETANAAASLCKAGDVKDCCGDGVMESTAPLVSSDEVDKGANGHANGSNGQSVTDEPRNFEEFIYKVWGAGIAKHFAIPYNRKLWTVPLSEMETSWLGGRVPLPDLEQMIEGALQPVGKPMGPNARFGYPLRGGFQALMNGFLPYIQDRLWLNRKVKRISPGAHTVTFMDDMTISYEQLISTMPLPVLLRVMGDEVPESVHQAAAGLRHVSVRCVNLGIGRENVTAKHWIYYPEETIFHRIFVQGNASPHCNPPGGFGLTCEITYSPYKPLPCDGDELIERCIADCRAVGIISQNDPIWTSSQIDMPFAYVVYDHARPKNVAVIRDWLKTQDVMLAGRYSEWEYYNSDHAFIAGKKVCEAVQARRSSDSKQAVV